MKIYLVVDEYAGSPSLEISIYTSRTKALKEFYKLTHNLNLDIYTIDTDGVVDEDYLKEIHATDGAYGLTYTFKEAETNKIISIF